MLRRALQTLEERELAREQRMLQRLQAVPAQASARYAESGAAPYSAIREAVAGRQKVPGRVQPSIRDSANGEECLVRIPGVCSGDAAKTIWSHAPLGAAGKGRSIKALDLCGAYCCTACDAVVDGQAPAPPGVSRAEVLLDWMYGHMRSLVRLRQRGLV